MFLNNLNNIIYIIIVGRYNIVSPMCAPTAGEIVARAIDSLSPRLARIPRHGLHLAARRWFSVIDSYRCSTVLVRRERRASRLQCFFKRMHSVTLFYDVRIHIIKLSVCPINSTDPFLWWNVIGVRKTPGFLINWVGLINW